jgi:hypothetical protein
MATQSIWSDWLSEFPALAYDSARPRIGAGISPNAASYYRSGQGQNQFTQDFQQAQGDVVRAGGAPTLQEYDYLEQYPWLQKYAALSPSQRGGQRRSLFNPRSEYLGFV